MSRVLLQAIAEAAGVAVPIGFKSDHLFLKTQAQIDAHDATDEDIAGSDENASVHAETASRPRRRRREEPTTEVVPAAEFVPEPDAIEELVNERSTSVLIVPRDTRHAVDDASSRSSNKVNNVGTGANAEADTATECPKAPGVVVLRDGAVKGALPRGATVVLPGSYNPLHKGHLGLLEAARALHSRMLNSELRRGAGQGAEPRRTDDATAELTSVAVQAVFELSVANADKGGLAVDDVRRRTRQFTEAGSVGWPYPLVVTRAPLFSQKVGRFLPSDKGRFVYVREWVLVVVDAGVDIWLAVECLLQRRGDTDGEKIWVEPCLADERRK